MRHQHKLIVSGIFFLCVIGCRKFVEIGSPTTQLVTASVFESDQTAIAAMNGIYSYLMTAGGFADGSFESNGFLCGLSADELTNYGTQTETIEFYKNQLTKNNTSVLNSVWGVPYKCLYDVNSLMEGLNQSAGITAETKKELTGEALFLRAFCNFYLTGLFGDVPLITSSDYVKNAKAPRTAKDSVFNQMVSDLLVAQSMLKPDYSASAGERVRPNAFAATALLARVYLFANNWSAAETQASQVIQESRQYSLPALNDVFLKNSPEAIWQLEPNIPSINTQEGNMYILDGPPLYATLSPELISAFGPGDQRRQSWVADTTIDGISYSYPFKYKIKTGEILTEYSMVLRLAEQYLIRAECRMHSGNISGANEDLNMIRTRAGLAPLNISVPEDLLTAILAERQSELFTEWGHRWMDLVRTGKATAVLEPIKAGWQATDTLYPVPASEIQKDPNLTQNPGY